MPKRILIVEVNWVGDVLFTTPFIRSVRKAYPDAYIACLAHPRTKQVLGSNPRIDELIEYDEAERHKGILGKAGLIFELRRKKFDTAFILHRSLTKAAITFLAGIGKRVGYPEKKRSFLLTDPVPMPSEEMHKVEYFLGLAKAAGIDEGPHWYEFFVEDKDRAYIKGLLSKGGISGGELLITICPGGNWDPKRWPKERFAELSDMLIERAGARIAIAGAEKDVSLAEEIKEMMRNEPVVTCGMTTLGQLGALLERSGLVVANDTGPMHMAGAVKTKVLALFGPTSPDITGPYGEAPHRVIYRNDKCDVPCYDMSCRDNRCMADIKVEDVFNVAQELMNEGRSPV